MSEKVKVGTRTIIDWDSIEVGETIEVYANASPAMQGNLRAKRKGTAMQFMGRMVEENKDGKNKYIICRVK